MATGGDFMKLINVWNSWLASLCLTKSNINISFQNSIDTVFMWNLGAFLVLINLNPEPFNVFSLNEPSHLSH